MPGPVCAKCQRRMTATRPVVVQFNRKITASGHPAQVAYEQWMADLFECPHCSYQVVSGYAFEPFWREHHKTGREMPYVTVDER